MSTISHSGANFIVPLKIIVCIAQAYGDERPIRLDVRTGAIIEEDGCEHFMLDSRSEFALEMALRVKKAMENVTVQVITLGHEQVLRQALAIGADTAVRVSVKAFDNHNPIFVGRVLGAAIRIQKPDVVLFGSVATGSEDESIGAALASDLRFPYLADISDLELGFPEKVAIVRCRRKNTVFEYECSLPGLFTLKRGCTCPPAKLKRIIRANREKIPVISTEELNLPPAEIEGLKTGIKVVKYTYPKPKEKRGMGMPAGLSPVERFARVLYGGLMRKDNRVIIEGSSSEEAANLMEWLKQEKII